MKNSCYFKAAPKLLLSVFRSLSAVLGTGLTSLSYAGGIKRTADDVVTGTGKVLYTTAADQYYTVLLKVVTFAWDIGSDFHTRRKAHTSDLAESGVRLLGCHRLDDETYATTLRTSLERRRL